jgi:hypothetical protein
MCNRLPIKQLTALSALLVIGSTVYAQGGSDAERSIAAWEKSATFFPNEALAGFQQLGGGLETGPREARFGYAVALLSAVPSTEGNLDEAERIFGSLADTGDDEFGLGSRFLLGRMAQIYRSPSDPRAATGHFQWLVDHHLNTRWGQMSLVKLAMVLIYAMPDAGGPEERIAKGTELLEKAVNRDSRRDLNLIIASAHFHYGLEPTGAVEYLIEAEEEGDLDVGTRSDVLIQIGELLVLSGRVDEAIVYYKRFVDDFYGAARRYAVEQKILALQAGEETIP